MARIQEYELWEKNKRREMQYIKTSEGGGPQIFYMPKEHNDFTIKKYESSIALIEEEIKLAKATFEDDLLKIETKLNHFDDEEEEFDEEKAELKPRSVIVKQPHKRLRNNEAETISKKIKTEEKNSESDSTEDGQIVVKKEQ